MMVIAVVTIDRYLIPVLYRGVTITLSTYGSGYALALRDRDASACWPHTRYMSPRRRIPGYRPRMQGYGYRYDRGTNGRG